MSTPNPDPTGRFTGRAADYARYRPGYPAVVIDILRQETGLTRASIVADIGCGTGISAELFLRHGNTVHGVEPNAEMIAAAAAIASRFPRFHLVRGKAEATTLPGASVDYAVAAQAFHWFDRRAARAEFARILRRGGWLVLMWNRRRVSETPFLAAYEDLLQRLGTDYREVDHRALGEAALEESFGAGRYRSYEIDNDQRLDRAGLRGRLLSSSYAPPPGHPDHDPMLRELDRIFDRFAVGGEVRLQYDTELHFGHPA